MRFLKTSTAVLLAVPPSRRLTPRHNSAGRDHARCGGVASASAVRVVRWYLWYVQAVLRHLPAPSLRIITSKRLAAVATPERNKHATLAPHKLTRLRTGDTPKPRQGGPRQHRVSTPTPDQATAAPARRTVAAAAGVTTDAAYTVVTLRLGLSPDSLATVRAAVIAYGLPPGHSLLLRDKQNPHTVGGSVPPGQQPPTDRESPLAQLPNSGWVPLQDAHDDPVRFARDVTGGLAATGAHGRGFPVVSILQQGAAHSRASRRVSSCRARVLGPQTQTHVAPADSY